MKSQSVKKFTTDVAVVGDVHGHLQLACCVLARWQQELGMRFEAVFLCGDVAAFTDDAQLDNASRRHARANPCELEFLTQWAARPAAPWLDSIFTPVEVGGLGLSCPVVMVHGNHEGFPHLERLVPAEFPEDPVALEDLPVVDTNGHVRYLPSGWRVRLNSGHIVAGIGGIQPNQRHADYHPMAYISEEAVLRLLDAGHIDLVLTHQGPSGIHGEKGADLLQPLLDEGVARVWCHGHARKQTEPVRGGRSGESLVVPLGDIAFHVPRQHARYHEPCLPGKDGWARVSLGEAEVVMHKGTPAFLREYCRHHWLLVNDLLVCPPLARIAQDTVRKNKRE